MTQIVTLTVSQQVAPTPATLQKCGAFVCQGATILSPGSYSLLTQPSDLTPLIRGSQPISSLSWTGGSVTATTVSGHGFSIGDVIDLTIMGAVPTGYNGTFPCTITSSTQFTYPVAANPGAETTAGVYTIEDVAELYAQTTTFFGMGATQAVFVLEFGPGSPAEGVAALAAYIIANPNSAYTAGAQGFFYSYLVPRTWDNVPSFLSFLQGFESTTSRTYFHVTTTLATYAAYGVLMKDVLTYIEAPVTAVYPSNQLTALAWNSGVVTASTTTAHGVSPGDWFQIQGCLPTGYNGWAMAITGTAGSTLMWNLAVSPGSETLLGTLEASQNASTGVGALEFSAASAFWVALNWAPSSNYRVPPFAFSYLYGVTPFPTKGNNALLSTLKTAGVNIVGTGAEGGISNTILLWGTTMDLRSFNYWYSVDWAAINSDLAIANEVINGSNNPLAPLYYNQDGINRLQSTVASVMTSAVTFGLANGQVVLANLDAVSFQTALDAGTYAGQLVVNAVPFVPYLTAAPGDYKAQRYAGLSAQYIAQLGFVSIVFSILVTDFVTQ